MVVSVRVDVVVDAVDVVDDTVAVMLVVVVVVVVVKLDVVVVVTVVLVDGGVQNTFRSYTDQPSAPRSPVLTPCSGP